MRATVVVVEDEELIALFVRETLELAGFEVVCFSKGEDGLRYLQTGDAVCAIIDVGLPELRGDSLVQSIRQLSSELPIILSSGYSAFDLEKSFAGDPCLRVLGKPYNDTRLLIELEKLIAAPPAAPTPAHLDESIRTAAPQDSCGKTAPAPAAWVQAASHP